MDKIVFYVIRAKKNSPNYSGTRHDIYEFKKGWYASNEFVKPFKYVKIFTTEGKANAFLKKKYGLGFGLNREEYFEVVPLEVAEPVETKHEESKYKNGDFVTFYEGMGECGYGTIIGKTEQFYKIQPWLPNTNDRLTYVLSVTENDMRDKSTLQDAIDYYLVKSGQKK
jgi:hypothetical protein